MSETHNSVIAVIGIDIGKNSFHVVGLDGRGAIALRQKWSRGQVETRLANMPACLIGMEACVGAHHLSRRLSLLGHDARLMPAKYVRAYSKGQKNDFRDAEAIAEAVQRPTMKFVATKTVEQLDLQALHRVRERLVSQRTGVINQIRAFLLERGVAVRQGRHFFRAGLPGILATGCEVLSERMVHLIEDLAGDWRRLDERIEGLSGEIGALARQDAGCERLMSVPGIGPIISSAMVAAIGAGDTFTKGRLRRVAGPCPQTVLDGRPHGPWQDIQTRQSLSARALRSGRLGRADQVEELGALRAQTLDRGGQEAAAPQCAGDRACQQAGAHRMERSRPWPQLRGRHGCCGGHPACLIAQRKTEPTLT
jgi:transposase